MIAAPRAYAPLLCPQCGHLLGNANGDQLILGMVAVRRTARLTCLACGGKYLWKPDNPAGTIDKMNDVCFPDA